MSELEQRPSFPVLPLRDIVVFPHMIVPLFVGREKSVRALEDVMKDDKQILLVTQKNAGDDDPEPNDIFGVGTVGTVLQLLKLPDGTVKVLVEGTQRAEIVEFKENSEFFEAYANLMGDPAEDDREHEALNRSVIAQFEQYIKLNKKIPPEVLVSLNQIEDSSKLADTVASHLALKIPEKQELLELVTITERLERAYALMEAEIGVLQVEKRIRNRVKRQMEKTQREYYLNEQMKAIQKELGEGEDDRDEASELEENIAKTKLTKEAREKAVSELKKLRSMSPMSAEATVVRNYLDWILSIPWKRRSKVKRDINHAEKVLNEDHYGLGKVKERILEYLAVQQRVGKVRGPILCLVGPPGVGKTSLGKSIARATGRNFVRMSLGGVRDEAEIRGHRRTYIGSMPGKVIQSMKKAKKSNPLFLLDEIDKLGQDWRGDPSSALLEVLDPEQNSTFNDHYLEVDYDLSDVLFVTTANTLRIPAPLMDRMEIIRISGYTEDEKVEIAKRHLIAKQLKAHGMTEGEWRISDDALRDLCRYYTREAGVRSLEREIANLTRKAIKHILTTKADEVRLTRRNLAKFAGVHKYRFDVAEEDDLIGVTTGLAWTEVGGELLSVEAVSMPGKGNVAHTGTLGDVMKESVQAARAYIRSRSVEFGISPKVFEKRDIHVHVPEGATPKDGPSAGVAMCTSLVSALSGVPVGIKDIIDTTDMPTRLGSPIYAKNQPDADAACVAVIRSAGAIIMGKTVTTEFATFTPGKTVNPHNITHTPGGSSSGSAAAVADFMVPVAYGTQTSGSVIRPSSFCGLCGFKPSFGAVSRQGVLTIVPSFDCVGYMARCFDDISLIHRVVTGKQTLPLNDGLDRTPRIGICRSHQWSQADPASTEALEAAAQRVAELGAKTENISLPAHFSGLEAAHATIMDVGLAQSLKREFEEHHDLLSDRLLERMERGMATSTNKFLEALALAARCRTEIATLLANWDGFLTPSAVGEAPKGLKITGVPTFNMVWTLLHLPCITVPGFTGSSGLPVGVQIVTGLGGDLPLLALGKWLHSRLIVG